jgi:hypothetical protein
MQITTLGSPESGSALPSAIAYNSRTRFFFASKSGSVLAFQVFTA